MMNRYVPRCEGVLSVTVYMTTQKAHVAVLAEQIHHMTGVDMLLSRRKDTVFLHSIVTPIEARRLGFGSRALEMLCREADIERWDICLQLDTEKTPEDVLKSWYEGFGFSVVEDGSGAVGAGAVSTGRSISVEREVGAGEGLMMVRKPQPVF